MYKDFQNNIFYGGDILCIAIDKDCVWFGTDAGLRVYDRKDNWRYLHKGFSYYDQDLKKHIIIKPNSEIPSNFIKYINNHGEYIYFVAQDSKCEYFNGDPGAPLYSYSKSTGQFKQMNINISIESLYKGLQSRYIIDEKYIWISWKGRLRRYVYHP